MTTEDKPDGTVEDVSRDIDRTMTDLIADTVADPVETGTLLAELMIQRAELEDAELRRVEAVASALREARRRIHSARHVDDIVEAVCPAIAALTPADFVMLARLDGPRSTPLDAVSTADPARALPRPFALPRALTESGALPDVFTYAGDTVFSLDVDGSPVATVHVAAALDDESAETVRAFLASVGAAIALFGLRRRRTRQSALLRAVPAWHGWADDTAPVPVPSPPESLTDREQEIFALLLTGASNAAIAGELVVSVETVRSHVKRILHKCEAANRAMLIGRYGAAGPAGRDG